MVSVFPQRGFGHSGTSGVASYTKNLVSFLSRYCGIFVFADKSSNVDSVYFENGVWVNRCWRRGLLYPFQVFQSAWKRRANVDVLHVQHEYFLFGGAFSALLFPFLLLLLKRLGRPLVVTFHHVVPLNVISEEFLKDNMIGGVPFILRLGIFTLTRVIANVADVLVVHEEFFKQVLFNEYGVDANKVWVIPHGVEEPSSIINSDRAKEILGVSGKRVLLFFGYITGYKGIELLIDTFDFLKNDESYVLFIAGGEHPRLKGKRKYQEYLRRLKERAAKVSDRIIFTGFVPEDMIPVYFSAADLVIFPYKSVFSSSGPISLAMQYKKPLLISKHLRRIIRIKDAWFDGNDLSYKIELFFNSKEFQRRTKPDNDFLFTHRWENVAEKTFMLYNIIKKGL